MKDLTSSHKVDFVGVRMKGCGMAKHMLAKGCPVALLSRKKADEDRYANLLVGDEDQAVLCIGDTFHNVYTLAGNLGYKTQFVPHLSSSFNRLNGAS